MLASTRERGRLAAAASAEQQKAASGSQPLGRPTPACGPSVHVAGPSLHPSGFICRWQGSPPGTFKEMDRERRPCILVTHQNRLWFGLVTVGVWATCAWPLLLCLGLEQQSLHRLE